MERLQRGTVEHYEDAALYDHEYRRRRADVNFYRTQARRVGGEVLELGAGTGRLLVPLVRDGHVVAGLDLSQPMLRRCTERLRRLKPQVRTRARLVRGDFRQFTLGRRFPLIVCPFNAMMHLYTREDLARFFACVRQHLTAEGEFAFDVLNPDLGWLMRDPTKRWARTRFTHPATGKAYYYSTNHIYDPVTQIAWIRLFYEPVENPSGRIPRTQVVHLAHRQLFPEELAALVEHHGFVVVSRHGGFSGEPFAGDSDSQVYRCRMSGDV